MVKPKHSVMTPQGRGQMIHIDIRSGQVKVLLDDIKQAVTFDIDDILLIEENYDAYYSDIDDDFSTVYDRIMQ